MQNQARQKADPKEKQVRMRLSALIIDIAFDVKVLRIGGSENNY